MIARLQLTEQENEFYRTILYRATGADYGQPALRRAFYALTPVSVEGSQTMSVDKYWRVYIDFQEMSAKGIDYASGILNHEIWHVLRKHHEQIDNYQSVPAGYDKVVLANLAQDLEINDDIDWLIPGNSLMPERGIFRKYPLNKSHVQYFDKMLTELDLIEKAFPAIKFADEQPKQEKPQPKKKGKDEEEWNDPLAQKQKNQNGEGGEDDSNSDKSEDGDENSQSNENESGDEKSEDSKESGDSGEDGESGESDESGDSGESGEDAGDADSGSDGSESGSDSGSSGESGESGESGQAGKPGQGGQAGNSDSSGEPGDSGEPSESGQDGNSKESGDNENSDGKGGSDKGEADSNDTGDGQESDSSDGDSKGKGKQGKPEPDFWAGNNCGSVSGKAKDYELGEPTEGEDGQSDGLSPEEQDDVLDRVAGDIQEAIEKGIGDGRGGYYARMSDWAADRKKAKIINWKQQLRGVFKQSYSFQKGKLTYDRSKVARRQPVKDVIFPAMRAPRPTLAVAFDVSGSNLGNLKIMTTELCNIIKASGVKGKDLLAFAVDVDTSDSKMVHNPLTVLENIPMGGGTRMTPGYKKLAELNQDISILVTDGYVNDYPKQAPIRKGKGKSKSTFITCIILEGYEGDPKEHPLIIDAKKYLGSWGKIVPIVVSQQDINKFNGH